jgi:DNA primase
MTKDISTLLGQVDLLSVIGSSVPLKRVARNGRDGSEYAGPCPFCKDGDDRFRVWPEHSKGRGRFWCRVCGSSGDAIDYLQGIDGLSFPEAVKVLGGDIASRPIAHRQIVSRPPDRLAPPAEKWQSAARDFVEEARSRLWTVKGTKGLNYLHERGLDDETIRAAGLGYNDSLKRQLRSAWGLEPSSDGKIHVWLPEGVVIPWEIGGVIWKVNIRVISAGKTNGRSTQRYSSPPGCAVGLYNADAIDATHPVVLVEGELDALTITQFAGDLVVAVATGSTSGARRAKWIARLAPALQVLVAFDAEEKGDAAAAYWLDVLPNAKRWRPYWKDANAMAQDGADVRGWIAAGLGVTIDETSESEIQRVGWGLGLHEAIYDGREQPDAKASGLIPGRIKLDDLLDESRSDSGERPAWPCSICGATSWWQHTRDGRWICGRCHPKPSDLVANADTRWSEQQAA